MKNCNVSIERESEKPTKVDFISDTSFIKMDGVFLFCPNEKHNGHEVELMPKEKIKISLTADMDNLEGGLSYDFTPLAE